MENLPAEKQGLAPGLNCACPPFSASLTQLPPESCDGCGLCCEGIGSPVLLYASRPGLPDGHPFRPINLPEILVQEIDDHFSGLTRGQEPQDRCLWFDPVSRSCQHYEFRPQICRDYELGGRACLQRRKDELNPIRETD